MTALAHRRMRLRSINSPKQALPALSLIEIELPLDLDVPLPADIDQRIEQARTKIERFQDRWQRHRIEQFVASDFELVYRALSAVEQRNLISGRRFCEWGCGFAVVSCLADRLGWDAIGIEAEADLIAQARLMIADWQAQVELWHGNFLPHGADQLADDPALPSLGHPEPSLYWQHDLLVEDFDLIFAYPWPGEGDFLERVFEKFAQPGACFLTFCGPYDLRLVRKVSSHSH